MNEEMMKQAKEAKTVEELLALAKEHGMDVTEEQAKAYFAQLHTTGELADDELDNVAGGGCSTSGGYTVVSSGLKCFTGDYAPAYEEHGDIRSWRVSDHQMLRGMWSDFASSGTCGSCYYLAFTSSGSGYCLRSGK